MAGSFQNFPQNPSVGQQFSDAGGNVVWEYTGTLWNRIVDTQNPSSGAVILNVEKTPPQNVTPGYTIVYEGDTGDGTGSGWRAVPFATAISQAAEAPGAVEGYIVVHNGNELQLIRQGGDSERVRTQTIVSRVNHYDSEIENINFRVNLLLASIDSDSEARAALEMRIVESIETIERELTETIRNTDSDVRVILDSEINAARSRADEQIQGAVDDITGIIDSEVRIINALVQRADSEINQVRELAQEVRQELLEDSDILLRVLARQNNDSDRIAALEERPATDSDTVISIITDTVDVDFIDNLIEPQTIRDEVNEILRDFDDSDFVSMSVAARAATERAMTDSDIRVVQDAIEVLDVVDNRSSQFNTDFRIAWDEATGTMTFTDGPPGMPGSGTGTGSGLNLQVTSTETYDRTSSTPADVDFTITHSTEYTINTVEYTRTNGTLVGAEPPISGGNVNNATYTINPDDGVQDITLTVRVVGTRGAEEDSDTATFTVSGYVPLRSLVASADPSDLSGFTTDTADQADRSSFTFSGTNGNNAYIASTQNFLWMYKGFDIITNVVGTHTVTAGTTNFSYTIYEVGDDIAGPNYTITK